ncbi:MAG: phosphoribosylformylglycinamidine synthase [Actinobacteria bacterium]|nr:phosphoribosylformylglycinamidine synthase [Actinomycetota bacterium]
MERYYRYIVNNFEYCFYVKAGTHLTPVERDILRWLLAETFEPQKFGRNSFLKNHGNIVEIGPRLNFETAYSTNAVAICNGCGLGSVMRLEKSRRYRFPGATRLERFIKENHDRMTECVYKIPLKSFETGATAEEAYMVPLLERGIKALEDINIHMGLGFDRWDMEFYYDLFTRLIGRNPTNVECFQLSQANSEHSRHWFFKGKLILDGKEIPGTLMQLIKEPLCSNPTNSLIAFKDNSSAIRGYKISTIIPSKPGFCSPFEKKHVTYHPIFTAETHNFPSGIAPFPGAETGTGGRIRDVEATGRGGLVVAGTAGYCTGNLNMPDFKVPGEDKDFIYPSNMASPLEIMIGESNGASDYGNKFGEPVIQGFTRTFGQKLAGGERREWIKPIMFSGGIGQIDNRHIEKFKPRKGMLIIQIGGPAYRIGIGGGSASSLIQDEAREELDFNAVQRGNAQMEQKMNRVIRACIEMGDENPVLSIHDQGAGGPCNVLTEIVEPAGGRIEIRNIQTGDRTMSVLEIWGAEYQERNALLINPVNLGLLESICLREKVNLECLGEITGDGRIIVHDSSYSEGPHGDVRDFSSGKGPSNGVYGIDNNINRQDSGSSFPGDISRSDSCGYEDRARVATPVDLDLKKILSNIPQKTFELRSVPGILKKFNIPENLAIKDAVRLVFNLPSVGSKGFLVRKVDRSVTGLIARQQCCGPLQLPVSDVAAVAQGHFGKTGAAISIGEQPLKIMVDAAAGARMSVAEALTNMVWAYISDLGDIKCSVNWMWPAKLPGEGAEIFKAVKALSNIMKEIGIAVDGGKDSISMAARVGSDIIKAPNEVVVSAYAPMPDIEKIITPDIKKPGRSRLAFIDISGGRKRMGGSAIAQALGEIGMDCPDVDDPGKLAGAFRATQELIKNGLILAGHDRSDGGLITVLSEMAISGNCGMEIELPAIVHGTEHSIMAGLFNEELGLAIEYLPENEKRIFSIYSGFGLTAIPLGKTLVEKRVTVSAGGKTFLDLNTGTLLKWWEEISDKLESHQMNPGLAREQALSHGRKGPAYHLTFTPRETPGEIMDIKNKPKLAVLREEGSNGDREMASAFYLAGFEAWDVTMTDLLNGTVDLGDFRGVAFVGGFSYADVLGSAKGWAGIIKFNTGLREMFDRFYDRQDTFSFGVCNGCQLMALLGLVPWRGLDELKQPRFITNPSGRLESRWVSVRINESPSIMLKGMEGSVIGIWINHGEGFFYCPDREVFNDIKDKKLVPVSFVDDSGNPTGKYPFNPNCSPGGITGLCSPDGRHLALMPHPERAFLTWQWPWMPVDWRESLKVSPWLKIFQNAREWCGENP